ncbi:hypothetical protein B0T22DRAFT_457143 [Podospora appendiculata]|uniref:Uncharacterized protein n=1 Tax=Podospora appendiculata TaxID=314037 RepID=A0AAE1CBE0_9PEZI|nr:hypothetical protein B0T22DRAFT_457143 [Podospora appendiculata]
MHLVVMAEHRRVSKSQTVIEQITAYHLGAVGDVNPDGEGEDLLLALIGREGSVLRRWFERGQLYLPCRWSGSSPTQAKAAAHVVPPKPKPGSGSAPATRHHTGAGLANMGSFTIKGLRAMRFSDQNADDRDGDGDGEKHDQRQKCASFVSPKFLQFPIKRRTRSSTPPPFPPPAATTSDRRTVSCDGMCDRTNQVCCLHDWLEMASGVYSQSQIDDEGTLNNRFPARLNSPLSSSTAVSHAVIAVAGAVYVYHIHEPCRGDGVLGAGRCVWVSRCGCQRLEKHATWAVPVLSMRHFPRYLLRSSLHLGY